MFRLRTDPIYSSPRRVFSTLDDDTTLLQAARAGDRSALELLLTRHEPVLLRLCARILAGAPGAGGAEAVDAVQETFLRALRALMSPKGFRGDSSVRTYLFRIAVNVCLEWRRLPPHISLSDDVMPNSNCSDFSPDSVAVDRIRIEEVLCQLQPRQRVLLILRELEGCSAAEIGHLFGWNEKRVYNELFKMRQRLLEWRDHVENGVERCDR